MNTTYLSYFLILRRAYKHMDNHVEVQISMNELMELFFCTQRNAKIIMSKLTEDDLIRFHSGRGRGNKSTIIFLVSFNQILHKQTDYYLRHHEINAALNLVKEYGEGTEVEDYVVTWLNQYFGYNRVRQNDKEIDLLRFPIYRPITTVDPARVFFDLDAHIVMQVFSTLVSYDFTKQEFQGCLAHSWETNNAKTNWLFFLRKGITFHNGKELTAEDVKRSILRLRESPHRWLVDDIENIQIQSPYVLLFTLKKPNELFLQFVSYTPMAIVDTTHYYDGFVEYPIGTGPFQLKKMESDVCELEAFPSYFQTRAHLDKIEIIRMSESVREKLLEGHGIMVNTGEFEVTNPNWQEKKTLFSGTSLITMNTRKNGPLKNECLRQKVNQLLDREELANRFNSKFMISTGFVIENQTVGTISSKEQLDHKDIGNQVGKLSLYTYHRHEQDAAIIQGMLQSHGMELEVNIVDWTMIQSKEILETADMILFEGTPNEGIISVLDLLLYEKGFIYPFLSDDLRKEVACWIDQIKRAEHSPCRYELYRGMEEFLKEKGVLLFLVHKQVEAIYSDLVEGVKFSSRMWVDFKELWYKHYRL